MSKFYVTMTDTFLSGWGKADGKKAKYIVCCDTYDDAERIEQTAKNRKEMKYKKAQPLIESGDWKLV